MIVDMAAKIDRCADVAHRAQLHLRRHCDCERMSSTCVRCETRLDALAALDAVESLREQMLVVTDQLDHALRIIDAVIDGANDCYECDDFRAEVAPLRA